VVADRLEGTGVGVTLPGCGDGLGEGDGEVTEAGRLTRQPWLAPVCGNAMASPSAKYRDRS
jgi:hypothetical protein